MPYGLRYYCYCCFLISRDIDALFADAADAFSFRYAYCCRCLFFAPWLIRHALALPPRIIYARRRAAVVFF